MEHSLAVAVAVVPAVALGGVLVRGWMQKQGKGSQQGGGDVMPAEARWSPLVQSRVSATCAMLGASVLGTAGIATLAMRTGLARGILLTRSPLLLHLGLAASAVGFLYGSRWARDRTNKILLYSGFVGTLGLSMSPLGYLGSGLLVKAAGLTVATMLPLCAVGMVSPSTKFLFLAGPLSMGLGAMSCLGVLSAFFPEAAGVHHLQLYGGLTLYCGLALYDTNRMVRNAETKADFDPIDESTNMYLDVLDLFITFVRILAESDENKKKKRQQVKA